MPATKVFNTALVSTPRVIAAAVAAAFIGAVSGAMAQTQEVLNTDLIIEGSLCVGAECVDDEAFEFDTVRIKGGDPILEFLDTSTSASFPTNEWSMGVDNAGAGAAPQFFIRDDSGVQKVLLLESGASGGVALGSGAVIEAGAISVGASGTERRIAFVADGTEDTDVATKGQLDTFIATVGGAAGTQLTADKSAIDGEITALEDELAALVTRLEALETALSN